MEELEIKPEGETSQAPDGETPQDPQNRRADHPEATNADDQDVVSPEAAAPDAETAGESDHSATAEPETAAISADDQEVVTQEALAPDADPSEAAQPDAETAGESGQVTSAEPQADSAEQAESDSESQTDAEEPTASKSASPVAIDDPDGSGAAAPTPVAMDDTQLMAVLEAVIYVAEEPLTLAQISAALSESTERVDSVLHQLISELESPRHGIAIREVAGGFKMATKAEHHEAVRSFVKSLKPPMKLSLPALETLAVIAYKQPVTAPEIMEIRGVQGAGVLKTLLDRKLIAVAGRKNVIGKPILYKTTKDFLIQFGLNDVNELPSLKEFEDIRRMAFADNEVATPEPSAPPGAETTQPAESEPATLEQES